MSYKNSVDYPINPRLLQISNFPYYECFPRWIKWEELCLNNNVDAQTERMYFTQWEQVSPRVNTNNASSSTNSSSSAGAGPGPIRRRRTNKIQQYTIENPRRSTRVQRAQPQQNQNPNQQLSRRQALNQQLLDIYARYQQEDAAIARAQRDLLQ